MTFRDVKSRKAVFAAMAECRHLGREEFSARYGFRQSSSYVLRHDHVEYDSKPILAVAYKYQFPSEGPLKNAFHGGKSDAGRHLVRLGFSVDGVTSRETDWRLEEVQIMVREYFDMMSAKSAGTLNKTARFKELGKSLVRRNRSSLSRKCSNISSVLDKLGLPWLDGFRPLPNVQILLEAVIIDLIDDRPELIEPGLQKNTMVLPLASLEVEPPTHVILQSVAKSRKAVRVDYADRDERNRKLGKAGEEWAISYFQHLLTTCRRTDLSDRVDWVSQSQGDGLGYDIAAFETDGTPIFVEVKTTNGSIGAPFVLSSTELSASGELGSSFRLMRLFDFGKAPRFYVLKGNLGSSCQLVPQTFRAAPISGEQVLI